MLILKRGEDVLDSLSQCAKAAQLQGGMISGLGAVESPELGFFDLKKSAFTRRRFTGMFEVLAVSGNFSRDGTELTTHVHVSLGRSNFRVIGGHLLDAKVAVTMELFVVPLGEMPMRTMNPELGLKLIDPDAGAQTPPGPSSTAPR